MSGWVINKIGLINFWYYDQAEFEFSDGRLLLRGSNGSGKSVTMQSFIPLLLDGNKSASRLDPFGTNSRKLENYLLMDGDNRDENTGYLYMEFVKPQAGNYLTIGIGLRARRSKPIEFWGFSITDGKRIGKDFYLYKDVGEKIPLTKRELKNRIVENEVGEYCESTAEYKMMVNNHIFGFSDISEYEQLIELLIQLRSPKLSKDYKPTVLYEIMEKSLKPLSDEDLRPMSEAIDNMDNIETSIAGLKAAYSSANRLKNVYDKYNSGILYYKAEDFVNSLNELKKLQENIANFEEKIQQNNGLIKAGKEEAEKLSQRKQEIDDKLKKYSETDVYKINQRIIELDEEIKNSKEKMSDKEYAKSQREDAKRQAEIDLRENENIYEDKEYNFSKTLADMTEYAEEAVFGEHKFFAEEINNSENFEFADINLSAKNHSSSLKRVINCFKATENAEKEYDKAVEQYSKEKAEHDHISTEIQKAEKILNEEKGTFIEKLYLWNRENKYLVLNDEELQKTAQGIYAFENFSDIAEVKAEINNVYNNKKSEWNTKINIANNRRKELENNITELNKKIFEIQSQPDIAPELNDEQAAFRKELDNRGIPYLPLYQACDFNENTTDEERMIIEEAIMEMGLLNALIIPKQYRGELPVSEGTADKFIVPLSKEQRKDITIPLHAEQNTIVPVEDIREVLAEITKNDDEIYINSNGRYGISILKGFAGGKRPSRYIGAESRRRHKEEILKKLNDEINSLKAEHESLTEKINVLFDELELMTEEYNNAPTADNISEALSILKDLYIKERNISENLKRITDEVNKALAKLKECRTELNKESGQFELPKSIKAYQDASDYMDSYNDSLVALIEYYKDMNTCKGNVRHINENIEELICQIDELAADIRDLKNSVNKSESEKRNCEEVKRISGFANMEKEIEQMQLERNYIPDKLKEQYDNITRNETDNEHYKKRLDTLNMQFEDAKKECDYCKEVFSEELKLGYNDIQAENVTDAAEKALKNKPDKSQNELFNIISAKYYQEKGELMDYSVTDNSCFDDKEQKNKHMERSRLKLMARVRGAETDFYELIDYLENEIYENETLLTQKDKELFEDLLIDTLGRKMRARISSSERWVAEMNKKMTSMDTSSGLSFSLDWKSKPADSEDQMNTAELVSLLKKDSRILTDENIDKISKHFRSKLNAARLRRDENADAESMHTILKDVLDYRKWFEFKLFYKMTGEAKKELTNNAFYRFSGGEKAMAMYVPLFASVYARYAKASEDAPKLISLDEAFAGIDDKNISDMFRIMEELKLSYIINSQALWGTYSTVPSLSIYELLRPNNSDTVSATRYKWNGKVKELII